MIKWGFWSIHLTVKLAGPTNFNRYIENIIVSKVVTVNVRVQLNLFDTTTVVTVLGVSRYVLGRGVYLISVLSIPRGIDCMNLALFWTKSELSIREIPVGRGAIVLANYGGWKACAFFEGR